MQTILKYTLLGTKWRKEHHYLIWFILIYAERTGVESWFAAHSKTRKMGKMKKKKHFNTKLWHRTEQTPLLSLYETNCWGSVCVVYVHLTFVCVILRICSCQRRDGEIGLRERERENKSKAAYNVDGCNGKRVKLYLNFFSSYSGSIWKLLDVNNCARFYTLTRAQSFY